MSQLSFNRLGDAFSRSMASSADSEEAAGGGGAYTRALVITPGSAKVFVAPKFLSSSPAALKGRAGSSSAAGFAEAVAIATAESPLGAVYPSMRQWAAAASACVEVDAESGAAALLSSRSGDKRRRLGDKSDRNVISASSVDLMLSGAGSAPAGANTFPPPRGRLLYCPVAVRSSDYSATEGASHGSPGKSSKARRTAAAGSGPTHTADRALDTAVVEYFQRSSSSSAEAPSVGAPSLLVMLRLESVVRSVVSAESRRHWLDRPPAEDLVSLSLIADAPTSSSRAVPVPSKVIDSVYSSQREPSVYLLQLLHSADDARAAAPDIGGGTRSTRDRADAASTWAAKYTAGALEACCAVFLPRPGDDGGNASGERAFGESAAEVTGRVSRYLAEGGTVR